MEKHLKRRPAWYKQAIIFAGISALGIFAYVKRNIMSNDPADFSQAPAGMLIVGLSLIFVAMTEMAVTVRWNDQMIEMYNRWGFNRLGGKTITLQIGDLTSLTDIMAGAQIVNDLPFNGIEFSDGFTALPIMTRHFFRAGIQELMQDVVRLRPDLPLTDNLQAYMRGDLDGSWPS